MNVSALSSDGSAFGQGCSQTRPPSIISQTSAPRCGAKGKISEAAVAVAKRKHGVVGGAEEVDP